MNYNEPGIDYNQRRVRYDGVIVPLVVGKTFSGHDTSAPTRTNEQTGTRETSDQTTRINEQ